MAKILITGATGFVGSHILETLINLQHDDIEIVAACRDSQKLLPNFKGEVRQGDLRDPEYLDRMLVGIDIVCHAAGWSSFEKYDNTCIEAYLNPTLELISHAIEWRVKRFVNLSSLFVATAYQRNNEDSIGRPRAYWPMMNCLLGIEDYLRKNYSQKDSLCQFVNLRLGLYSGKRLNMGLLSLLLARNEQTTQPYITGKLGHLPIVDGQDIGQAFVRAALAPFETNYTSLNIAGPSSPSHLEVMSFINEQIHYKPLSFGLPSYLASPLLWLNGNLRHFKDQPLFTSAMIDMLKSPEIENSKAIKSIGYDPEISWQASLLNTLEMHKNQLLNYSSTQPYQDLNL